MNKVIVPEIETERLMLRQATKDRLNEWAERIFSDPEVLRYMPKRDMTPYERAERAFNIYNELWKHHNVGGWVIINKVDGQLIGSCEIEYLDETDEYELGYALGKAYWGNGFATEAARALTRFGFESAQLERIIAVVIPENIASWRVLEHIGYVYEKKARYYDLDVVYHGCTQTVRRFTCRNKDKPMNKMIVPEIETERLLMREITPNDLDEFAQVIFADPDVMRYMPKRDLTLLERVEMLGRSLVKIG